MGHFLEGFQAKINPKLTMLITTGKIILNIRQALAFQKCVWRVIHLVPVIRVRRMSAELNPYHKRDFTYDQQYLIILIRCISCADINQYIRLDVTSYDNDSI